MTKSTEKSKRPTKSRKTAKRKTAKRDAARDDSNDKTEPWLGPLKEID